MSGIDVADHGLAARLDMDMFDRDLLLTFTPVFVEGVELAGVNCQQLGRMLEVLVPAFKRLPFDHSATQTFHGGGMGGHHLGGEHPLEFVRRFDPLQQRDSALDSKEPFLRIQPFRQPQCLDGLGDQPNVHRSILAASCLLGSLVVEPQRWWISVGFLPPQPTPRLSCNKILAQIVVIVIAYCSVKSLVCMGLFLIFVLPRTPPTCDKAV